VTDGAEASVLDPGIVDDGGVGSESVEMVAERGDSMEVENLLGATPEIPSAEPGVTVGSVSAAVVAEGGGLGPKSVETAARSGDSMGIENDGDNPDEAFHDASDHEVRGK